MTVYRPLQAGTPGTPGTNNRVMLTASEGENVRSGIMVTVPVPTFRPMLASSATQLPKGAGWSYEVKWDGYRTLAVKDGPRVKLLSRSLKDATRQYPTVAREVTRLQAESVLLDGEVVAIDDQGRPSFQALHHQSAHRLVFVAAEVLHLDGRDLTAISLSCKLV